MAIKRCGPRQEVAKVLEAALDEAYGALEGARESYRENEYTHEDYELEEREKGRYGAAPEMDRSIFDDVDE